VALPSKSISIMKAGESMSKLSKTAPSAPERALPQPVAWTAASSDHPPTPAPMSGPMGALELAAYRADWRASLRYRRHVADVAAAREHELLIKKLEEEARIAAEKAMRAAGKKVTTAAAEARKTVAWSSPNQQEEEQDEERETFFVRRRPPPPSRPVTPARAAARLLFARMFDLRPELREAMGSSAPVVLVDVPRPEMLERVLATWQDTLFPETARVMEVGASNSGKRDDYDIVYIAVKDPPKAKDKSQRNDEALSALSLALPLIAISPAAETHCPRHS
jgi:cell division protease FtsH